MILGIDTATRWTGIALHDGAQVVTELGWKAINTQTIELAPTVQTFLRKAAITAADLTAIAVAIGPGSYTGLRVGLGFAKGMALAYQLPLIGVPTLDIVASSFGRAEDDLWVAAEAGRRRVCIGRYQWQRGWQPIGEPDIESWRDVLERLEAPVTFAGEISVEARKQIRQANRAHRVVSGAAGVRRAGYLTEIGWRRYRHAEIDSAASLVPIYLRDPAGARPTT